MLTGSYDLRFERRAIRTMAAPGRKNWRFRIFEHGVHDLLRAHYLQRLRPSQQGDFPGRLRIMAAWPTRATCSVDLYVLRTSRHLSRVRRLLWVKLGENK